MNLLWGLDAQDWSWAISVQTKRAATSLWVMVVQTIVRHHCPLQGALAHKGQFRCQYLPHDPSVCTADMSEDLVEQAAERSVGYRRIEPELQS